MPRIPLLLSMGLFMAGPLHADDGVDLEHPGTVAELGAIQAQLDAIAARVTACLDTGAAHASCLCDAGAAIARFNADVLAFDAAHPELRDRDLVRFRDPSGMSVAQSLDGLRRQARQVPDCS